jgi:hypothetical protein
MNAAQPSETQLLKTYIGLLAAQGSTTEQRLGALGRLVELVEPIDNANGEGSVAHIKFEITREEGAIT